MLASMTTQLLRAMAKAAGVKVKLGVMMTGRMAKAVAEIEAEREGEAVTGNAVMRVTAKAAGVKVKVEVMTHSTHSESKHQLPQGGGRRGAYTNTVGARGPSAPAPY